MEIQESHACLAWHGSWDWDSSPHTWRTGLYTGPSPPMLIKYFLCAQPKLFLTDKDSALLLRCIGEKNHKCMHRICLLMAHCFSKDKSRFFCEQLTTFFQTNWVQEISREHFFPELSQSRFLLKNTDLTFSDTSSGHPRRPFSRRLVDFYPLHMYHSLTPAPHTQCRGVPPCHWLLNFYLSTLSAL